MKRPMLALCLSLVTGLAFAGEAATRNGYDGTPICPKAAAKATAAAPAPEAGTEAPVSTPTSARKSVGGGAASTKLISPRWHSLLPGMFR